VKFWTTERGKQMRIKRIPKDEMRGPCHDCHNRAEFEVTFGEQRPTLRLCLRDAKYLAGFLQRRVDEHERGDPIPKSRFAQEEQPKP